jgi:spermidine synthase
MTDSSIEYLAHEDTPLGTLILQRHTVAAEAGATVTEIMLDQQFLMSSRITFSERKLASVGLEMHPGKDLRVLVGGLGLGYTVFEVGSSDRVARAEVVEFSGGVISWMKEGLVPLSRQIAEETRIVIVKGDVFRRLGTPPVPGDEPFDLILIDVDHAPTERLDENSDGRFYSPAGLRAAERHLAPGGVLGVWSYKENSQFADAMREVFGEVRLEPVTFLNDVIDYESTDWLFFGRAGGNDHLPNRAQV